MQITRNIPDDLPPNIVQQYIKTVETQKSLMSKLTTKPGYENKTVSVKRGSAKKMITLIVDDFCGP
ncbi:MAG: hypothetical protein Q7T96_12005 [Methylobacter sp.]|nr:hypothetical protein [Methylobacter sp.]